MPSPCTPETMICETSTPSVAEPEYSMPLMNPLPLKMPPLSVTPLLMMPFVIAISCKPLPIEIAVPFALAAVEEIVNPFKSKVTPLALMLMALPVVTLRLVVK